MNGPIDVAAVATCAEIRAFDVAVTKIAPDACIEEFETDAIVSAACSVPIEVPAIASTRLKRMFCASQPIELNASVTPIARLGDSTIVFVSGLDRRRVLGADGHVAAVRGDRAVGHGGARAAQHRVGGDLEGHALFDFVLGDRAAAVRDGDDVAGRADRRVLERRDRDRAAGRHGLVRDPREGAAAHVVPSRRAGSRGRVGCGDVRQAERGEIVVRRAERVDEASTGSAMPSRRVRPRRSRCPT